MCLDQYVYIHTYWSLGIGISYLKECEKWTDLVKVNYVDIMIGTGSDHINILFYNFNVFRFM